MNPGKMHRRSVLAAAASATVLGLSAGTLAQPRPSTQVVVEGQPTGIPNVNIESFFTSPTISINEQGKVYFFAALTGSGVTPAGTSTFGNNHAGFQAQGTNLTLVVRRDDLAAGFPDTGDPALNTYYGDTGSAISQFIGTSSINQDNLGNSSFRSFLNGGTITPDLDDIAWYFGQPGSPQLIAQQNTLIPASATGVGGLAAGTRYGDFNFNSMVNNEKISFHSTVLTGTGVTNGTALLLGTTAGGSNTTLIAYGNSAGTGTTIGADTIFSVETTRMSMNSNGEVLFSARVNGTATTNLALIRGSSTASLSVVAKIGDASPIAGVTYSAFSLAGTGRAIAGDYVAFNATLAGTGVNASGSNKNNLAFFLTDNTGTLQTLVRENDPIPKPLDAVDFPATNVTQMRFADLGSLNVSSSGWVGFSSRLRADNATTANSAYDGVYLGRVNPGTNGATIIEMANEGNKRDFSSAAIHVERGEFDWAFEKWSIPSTPLVAVNANGQAIFYAGANAPGSVLTELEGYYYFDPVAERAFRLVVEGDELLFDSDGPGPLAAVSKEVNTITSLTASDGGAGDGRPSIFNSEKQLVFRATFTDGTEAIYTLDADDYIPLSFHIWDQTGGGDWGTDANWVGASPNGARTYAEFSSAITSAAPITVSGAKTVGEMFFKTDQTVSLTGDALTFEGTADLAHVGVARGTHSIANNLVLNDDTSFITDNQRNISGTTVTVVPTSLTLSGEISGAGDLRKGGPGVLRLTGNNTYTGNNVLRAGYLEISSSANLGSTNNAIVMDGGVMRFLDSVDTARPVSVTRVTRDTSDIQGGFDTGTNTATLSGALSYQNNGTNTSGDGVIYKTGTGKLILAGTGDGVGGVIINAGSVDVSGVYTNWGNGSTRANVGTTLRVLPGGSITSTRASRFMAAGGGTMIFDGPVNTNGQLIASWSDSQGSSLVNINAPSVFGSMSVSSRGGTNFAGLVSTVNVNASATVSGQVTISRTGGTTNGGVVNVATGATFSFGSADVNGALNVPVGASINQTDPAGSLEILSSVPTNNGRLTLHGAHTIAGDFIVGGILDKPANYVLTVGGDLGVKTGQTLVLDANATAGGTLFAESTTSAVTTLSQSATATITAGAIRVFGSGTHNAIMNLAGPVNISGTGVAEAVRGVINFNGPSQVIGGLLEIDAGTNNRIQSINFNNGTSTSGSLLLGAISSSTSAVTSTASINFGSNVTHTTGDITLRAARTSTSTSGTTFLRPNLLLDIAGNVSGGNMLIKNDEGAVGKNQATSRVNITGTLAVNRIIQEATQLGGTNTVFVSPGAVGNVILDIPGTLQIKPNGGTNATSVLSKLPNFVAGGSSTGKIDLTNNAIIFKDQAVAGVESALLAGYAGGAWNGTGIASSTAAAEANKTLGYAQAGALFGITGTQTASFMGREVDPDDVVVRFTVDGDLDLDGQVAFTDLLTVSANFGVNNGAQDYPHGDTDFDKSVTFVDLLAVAANFGGMLPASIPGASDAFNEALSAVAAQVPEPGTLAGLAFAGGAMLLRRRRQR